MKLCTEINQNREEIRKKGRIKLRPEMSRLMIKFKKISILFQRKKQEKTHNLLLVV